MTSEYERTSTTFNRGNDVIEKTVWRRTNRADIDFSLREYRITVIKCSTVEIGYSREVYISWNRAAALEVVKDAIDNVLTLNITVASRNERVMYAVHKGVETQGLIEDVLAAMPKETLRSPSKKRDDDPRPVEEYWQRASYYRKLKQAIKTLEMENRSAIQFKVFTTNYEVRQVPTGYQLWRNGKYFKELNKQ